MTKSILKWIRLRLQWHRLSCLIMDLKWVSIAGRENEGIRNQRLFKCFESWVDQAQSDYDHSLLHQSEYAANKAVAAFARMSDQLRLFLSTLAQAARMADYRMRVAQLCQ